MVYFNSRVLIGLQAMVYELTYQGPQIWQVYTSARTAGELKYCNYLGVFNKTIISLVLVGYEIVIAKSALCVSLTIYLHISNARSWNNCWLLAYFMTELRSLFSVILQYLYQGRIHLQRRSPLKFLNLFSIPHLFLPQLIHQLVLLLGLSF